MPEDNQDNKHQSEITPHFDAFSKHNTETEPTNGQQPMNNELTTSEPELQSQEISPNDISTPNLTEQTPSQSYASGPIPVPGSTQKSEVLTMQSFDAVKPTGFMKNKKIVIPIIIAVILLIIGGVSAFAYSTYQNPTKVITDSIINAMTAKLLFLQEILM